MRRRTSPSGTFLGGPERHRRACEGVPKQKITRREADLVRCAKARKVAKREAHRALGGLRLWLLLPDQENKQIATVRSEKSEAVVMFKKRSI
jgi:hypothetical protein